MTEGPGAKDTPHRVTDEEHARGHTVFGLGEQESREVLAWVGENLTQVRRSVSGQRLLYWSLGIGLVVGLAAHVGGYLLRSSVTTEPLGLVADLLYALGWALWTGVVVVVFVQIIPEAKRRHFKQALDAYEAAMRDQARVGGGRSAHGEVAVVHQDRKPKLYGARSRRSSSQPATATPTAKTASNTASEPTGTVPLTRASAGA